MTRKTTVWIALFSMLMLCFGLALPGVIEWISNRSIGAQQSVSVEPIDFESSSGNLFSILNLYNRSDEEIAYQPVKEGYNYTQETAAAHAADLLDSFVQQCGFENVSKNWHTQLKERTLLCEAMLVVVPDYPSPWSAILWTAELQNGAGGYDTEIVFDDATGAMLGCQIQLADQMDAKEFYDDELDLKRTEKAASAYAEQLEAEYENLSNWFWEEAEHNWSFTVIDGEDREVWMDLVWLRSESGAFCLILEPNGGDLEGRDSTVYGENTSDFKVAPDAVE